MIRCRLFAGEIDSLEDNTMKILRSIYLENEQVERLMKLSTKTKIPQAVFIREGLDLMLAKYENEIKGSNKKRKGR
jgi:predicted DNA-binding protein